MGLNTFGSHLIGGYIEYACLGPRAGGMVEYDLTIYLYIDCGPNSNVITEDVAFTIFDGNTNTIISSSQLALLRDSLLPDDISNPCVVSSPNVCAKEEVYNGTILLARNRPHIITYQRCCRNSTILNVTNSSDQGSTLTTVIPEYNIFSCNSTPVFNNFPPVSICFGFDVNLDLSAADADGDSLVYNLCPPYNHAMSGGGGVRPIPANPPPYNTIPYSFPFTFNNPVTASPAFTLNPITGRLNGTPNLNGQYILGYCVEEYRNGVLLNTTIRDIQVNTGNCSPVIVSSVQDQEQYCDGLTVQFKNQSTANVNIQSYKWDFGVQGVLSDTSRAFEPLFTFPDTGLYTITLISNPDLPCNNVSTKQFRVNELLNPTISFDGNNCETNNSSTFVAKGTYESYSTFEWDFGSNASILSSTLDSVPNVSFTGSNSIPVQLIVFQDDCSDTVNQIIQLFENPSIDFSASDTTGCAPIDINFMSVLTPAGATAEYDWNFGDGNTSSDANPTNTYRVNNKFDVSLIVRTTSGCIDTINALKPELIETSLATSINFADFTYLDSAGCYPFPVRFINQSIFDGAAEFLWTFGDGGTSTDKDPTHTYSDNGYYNVGLTLITTEKCVDTIFGKKDSAIFISLDSSKNEINFGVSSREICPGTPISFLDSSTYEGNADYYWDFGDNNLSNDRNPIYIYQDTGKYTIGLLLITKDKCVDTLIQSFNNYIQVVPEPISNLMLSDTMKPLKEATFTIDGTNSISSNASQIWVNDVLVSTLDSIDYTFEDTGHFVISHIAENSFGCFDTISAQVFIYDQFEFIIPNVFTPNGDNINDEFMVRACGVYDYEIEIFNRYGTSMFSSNSMNINWDGRTNLVKASPGVYFYKIRIKDFKGEYIDYTGPLTLLRD
jgi:gliding motility-associated-like protein